MIPVLGLSLSGYSMPSCNISLDEVDPYQAQYKKFATVVDDSFFSLGDLRLDASSILPSHFRTATLRRALRFVDVS
jgi:hypothetical protein